MSDEQQEPKGPEESQPTPEAPTAEAREEARTSGPANEQNQPAKPIWNVATHGEPPTGREDDYEVVR